MPNRFEVELVAKDKLTKVMKRVGGVTNVLGKNLHSLGSGVNFINKENTKFARSAFDVGKGVASILPPFQALIGAGSIAGLAALAVQWGKLGYAIKNASLNIGMTVSDLQELQGAAELSNVSSEALTQNMESFSKALYDSKTTSPAIAATLKTLGINLKNTSSGAIDTKDALMQVADVISSGKLNPQQQIKALGLLGMSPDMLPLLRRGRLGIQQLADRYAGYGNVNSDADIANRQAVTDAWNDAKARAGGVVNRLENGAAATYNAGAMNPLNSIFWKTGAEGVQDLLRGDFDGFFFGHKIQTWTDRRVKIPQNYLSNNNPGNLRRWGGVPTVNGFASFPTPQAGLEAMAKQLSLYGGRGIDTLDSIISAYAPNTENDTSAYIADVAKRTGFDPSQHLNLNDPDIESSLMGAMIQHEQGSNPFTPDMLRTIVQEVASRPLKLDITLTGAPAGTTATATDSTGNQYPARIQQTMPTGINSP